MRTLFVGTTVLVLACAKGRPEESPSRSIASASRKLASMTVPREGLTLVRLPDGRFFTGDGDEYPKNSAEIYDPVADTWKKTVPTDSHEPFPAVLLPDGRPAVLSVTVDAHGAIYDPSLDRWFPTKGAATEPRTLSTVTALGGGQFLIVGGAKAIGSPPYPASVQAEIYDAKSDAFSLAGTLGEARIGHRALALGDGRVLVIGGGVPGTTTGISTVEAWNPATKTFGKVATMNEARADAVAVKLASGKILVAGGSPDSDVGTSSAEIYDPVADKWTFVKSMESKRRDPFVAELPDGRVLVGGGYDGVSTNFSTTEIYSPSTASWSHGPSFVQARNSAAAVVLPSGAVLVAGGIDSTANVISTVELLEPGELGLDGGVDAGKPETGAPSTVKDPSYHACKTDGDCDTHFCVDGVCCDSRCDGRCSSCALPSSPGKCAPQPYGYDLRHECGPPGSCTATCDGTNACVPMRGGEQCAASHCTDRSHGVGPASCPTAGAACGASAAVAFDCGAYVCEPAFGVCLVACSTSDQCADGYNCDVASKTCIAAGPTDDGGGCAFGRAREGVLSLVGMLAALSVLARRRRS